MWDLDTLMVMNERACRADAAPILPLHDLANRLVVGPPSLKGIIELFEDGETLRDFLKLVREYLPDHEQEIMAGSIDQRVSKFSKFFEKKYFPLSDACEEIDLPYFCEYIPVELMGISYDDYHNLEGFRYGILMMMSLVVYPYSDAELEPCSRGMFKGYEGGRVPIIEEVAGLVGKELASEIPDKGWKPEALQQMTVGTRYEGLASCAHWICGATGLWLLDAAYSEYSEEKWTREVVEGLTEQWPKVKELQEKVFRMADWLEADPKANFGELLHFLLKRKDSLVPKEQLPLPLDGKGQVKLKPKKEREVSENEIVQAATF